ncbi:glutamate receptor ionotropic, NMDA 2B [Hyalella azteca]|uniref:Glutamate receptor ionotropic, NMDA 2B n=1 Tax=Hyalella azteca TaxID=294128 RepID=A0A8B7NL63_HYAAZ|nr:glutamate receptor ionotropic, NMDA 2B [Hyalella azteca]
MQPPRDHPFSLFRTLWLVWAILFQAAVNVDCPKGFTARFMGNVWAMFALIFLAIYTANLAAFMITREEFHDMSGLDDKRLQNPTSVKPRFKFGTMLHGHTDVVLKNAFPAMHAYMRQFNQTNAVEGVKAVKKGQLDAFIYDATVLEYLTGQDDECKLLTVGSWYALTGYGVAFPRNSKYLKIFNNQILKYRESGELERLSHFWFTGACKPDQQRNSSSEPLALEQFMSTFVMLGFGVALGGILLCMEHMYFKHMRKHLVKKHMTGGCCNLISMSMGKSITMLEVVREAQEQYNGRHCDDPLCDTDLWRVKHELDMARLRIVDLETQMVCHGIKHRHRQCELQRQDSIEEPEMVHVCHNYTDDAYLRKKQVVSMLSRGHSDFFEDDCGEPLLRTRDMTQDFVRSNEPIRGPLLSMRHRVREVAELETVL